jgi:hypothetical protein
VEQQEGGPRADAGSRLSRRLLDAQLGSLAAGLVVVFTVFKVLFVAHFDTTTALGVVSESSTASLVVGALVLNIGPVLIAVLAFVLAVTVEKGESRDPDTRTYGALGAVLTVFAIGFAPLLVAGAIFITTVTFLGSVAVQYHRSTKKYRAWQREKDVWRESDMSELERLATDLAELDQEMQETDDLLAELDQGVQETNDLLAETPFLEDMRQGFVERLDEAKQRMEDRKRRLAGFRAQHVLLGQKLGLVNDKADMALSTAAEAVAAQRRLYRQVMKNTLLMEFVINGTLALVILLTAPPWLPAERIFADGQPSIIGYVLHADQDELVVLTDGARKLVRIEGSKVQSRRFCRVRPGAPSWLGRPVLSFLYQPPFYPECRRLSQQEKPPEPVPGGPPPPPSG